MPLSSGDRLGPYEIIAKLGEGGMGEVYRAKDTKLGREVAIKVLPAAVAQDAERLARFKREAQVLASLNHPNIAAIHGLEDAGDKLFLVLELVEGEDLSAHLRRGPMPVADALEVARQIACALEEAHDKGIVHRDLKPANVKLTPDGKVKVLDFGLAKALDPGPSVSGGHGEAAMSPTVTSLGTVAGVILGTAAYMSPEQARAKSVDKRADIWAFGVVLFEMLAGRRLFEGETISDTLAAVLKTEPDWTVLPPTTPAAVRRLLVRCLDRDPRLRLRDIGEARILLSGNLAAEGPASEPSAPKAAPARLPWLLFAVAAIAAAILGVKAMMLAHVPPVAVRKFEIDAHLRPGGNVRVSQIAPDGTRIVYQSDQGIELRELRETEPRLLVKGDELGTGENGATPFWSPDGASIGYAANGALVRIPAAGGAPATICKLPGDWNGGAWMGDETIAFATTRGPMYRVPARGGDPVVLLPLQAKQELDFHHPSVLPDGHSLIYAVHRTSGVDTIEMLRDGKRTVVLRVDTSAVNVQDSPQIVNEPFYSPTGHILYQRDQGNEGLWALPFSAERGAATGDPFLLAAGMGSPSVSADGSLIYTGLNAVTSGQLLLVTRDGKTERTLGGSQPLLSASQFSSDGRRLLYVAAERQTRDVYVWDFDADRATRLTDTPESEGEPTWIPGGNRVAFSAPSGTCRAVFSMKTDGTGTRELLAKQASEPSFTPDGKEFVYATVCQERRGLDRAIVGRPEVTPLIDAAAGIDIPALSPDGRFLAYRSFAGGTPQIYITPYPSMDGRWTLAGASSAFHWSADGKEIFYVDGPPFRMMAAPVQLGPVFSSGTPRVLFDLAPIGLDPFADFAVSPDGKRFAVVRGTDTANKQRKIVVVENWFEEFRKP